MNDGKHQDGFKYRNARNKSQRGRNSVIGTIFTAIMGTVIKDLTSENSKIKKLFTKFSNNRLVKGKKEDKQTQIDKKEIIDIEYKNVGK